MLKRINLMILLGSVMIPQAMGGTDGFKRSASPGSTVSIERMQRISKSPHVHRTPPQGGSATSGMRFRGLVLNADVPYIGEFSPEPEIKITNIHSDPDFVADGSAVYGDGKFYTQWTYSPSVGAVYVGQSIYDANTWSLLEEREDMMLTSAAVCITYDPLECAAYGYFQNDYGGEGAEWLGFGRMNMATGDVFTYNSVDEKDCFMCIAASPDGYLYGVNTSGQYCRIDKTDGKITVLGHTDVKPHYMQSAVIDWDTGDFYWACMTDTGKSILYKINPVTYIAEKVGDFPNSAEWVGLYIVKDAVPAETPAAVQDATLSFDRDNLNGVVSFYAPEFTEGGTKIDGTLKVHVAVDGKHYEAQANPGSKCDIPVQVRNGGLYIVTMWATDGDSEGSKSTVQKWIGPDYPTGVKNLKLTNTNGHLKLTWDAPSAVGQHGGYVDTDNLSFIIHRSGAGYMKSVTLNNQYVFEQDIADGITDRVSYSISPIYKELVGELIRSNEVQVGNEVRSLPMSINASSIADFIVIDANNDGKTWQSSFGYAMCETSSNADDWMLTPKVALRAGEIYELTYETSAKMGALYKQILEVKCGVGDDVSSMVNDIDRVEEKGITLTQFSDNAVDFTVPADGNYRIGFHNISSYGTLGLGTIKVKAKTTTAGPKAPSSCTVEAAPMGELKATIRFKAPSQTNEDTPLEALSSIIVMRGAEEVGRVNNPTPGAQYSVVDANAVQGMNNYTITAVDTHGAKSSNATAKSWVGMDIPSSPYNVNMTVNGNKLDLSWKIGDKGIHGGYVKLDEVVYKIIDPLMGTAYAQVVGANGITIDLGELTRQSVVQYGVAVSNTAGANNEASLTPTVVVGPSIKLPFHEHFNYKSLDHTWRKVGDVEEDYGWAPSADNGPDGQSGVSIYWGQYEGDEQSLTSGRMSLVDAVNPTLRFYYCGYIIDPLGLGADFSVEVSEDFESGWTSVFSYDFINGDKREWTPVEVSLSKYVGKDIFIRFHGLPSDAMVVGIDDISVRSALDYDAAIDGISVDVTEVDAGASPANVTVRVQNHGIKDIAEGSYRVDLYAGDRIFSSCQGKAMKAAFGTAEYAVEYVADMDDPDPVYLHAELVSDYDMFAENNKSNEVRVYVNKTYCPKVEDLSGNVENEEIVLHWTEPDQSGQPMRRVDDSFESYRNFATANVGEWTIIDEDKSPGVRTSYFFPGSAGALGWIVINPESIPRADGGTHADRFPAYTGQQYIAAFTPGAGDCKDWIITPELSGNAQEISFMARAESSKAGREMFEVYYSTTTPEISSMIRLDDNDHRTSLSGWEEFKFTLPSGAKYFAVRCVSHNRMVMHIDDFSYESAPTPLVVKLVGYNVYRDGVKVNDMPLTVTEYREYNRFDKEVKYTVRAVYDRGEASHSNEVIITPSGVDSVIYDINPYDSPVYDLSGCRVYNLVDGTVYVSKDKKFVYKARK